jgi:hypothetical protein
MTVRRIVAAGAAVLVGCGVLGMAPAAVQASSAPAATWTKQAPAASPPARSGAAMAYDAATKTVVLFGGHTGPSGGGRFLADTWTWNGSTWTKRAPAASPAARYEAMMAYDAATSTVVLFGGHIGNTVSGRVLADTWTWG